MRTRTGTVSAFEKERTVCVAWPFTSLTPLISLLRKKAVTATDSCGTEEAAGGSST